MSTEAPAQATEATKLKPSVRLLPLVALIFFSVSGGAYGLEPLFSASGPGLGMILLFVTPVLYGIPVALLTSELGTAIPVEGGYYEWTKRAFGHFWGFQQGFLSWLTSWVDMALYPVMFADYLARIWAPAGDGTTVLFTVPLGFGGGFRVDLHWLIGVACVIVPLTALNILGAKRVGDSSVLLAGLALAPFVAIAVLGIPQLFTHHVNPVGPLTPPHTGLWTAAAAGMSVVMWNYNGFDSVSTITEEIENPRRNLPRALGLAMVVIIAAYVLPALGAMATKGWAGWQDGSFVDVARDLGGPWLQYAVSVGAMFAACGLFASLLMSNARIPFVMAEDGWVPKRLVRLSPRYGTPVFSLVLCSVVYALMCNDSFTNLLTFDVLLTNLTILGELAALVRLRVKEPDLPRPYKVPGGWFGLGLLATALTGIVVWAAWTTLAGDSTSDRLQIAICLGGSLLAYLPCRVLRRRHLAAH
ncbi:APC family permease [Streptacidiphilus jiangxiensis]|uniref:Amino acid transporter n=1 Tax=Streptacidiphilus jiangxiensis TaxID=235985 RepID=A0A1H7WUS2_STRJI|nr:APC family permease [Streptacidiphilus jiangxiensis]SEM24688.1 Amino acid transporter [Streptacidiphilus jiangxiensis]